MDAASEKDISERLILSARRTGGILIAVTHRLRWLGLYDEIWFVEAGKVVFKGKHELLLANDRYRLFCSQEEA